MRRRRRHPYTEQLTYLLFLKMAHERANRSIKPERIVPEEYSWQKLLDAEQWSQAGVDIKGDAYESLLSKGAEDIKSGAGHYVVFFSYASDLTAGDTNDTWDVFVRDTETATTRLLSTDTDGAPADASSFVASISADGRYVVFTSDATDLVVGDTNDRRDVFWRAIN